MDCEACNEGMIDLLFDELAAPDAERLRSHIESCDECAEAYERLRVGQAFANQMEMVAPPAGLLDGVLAAARDKAGPAPVPARPAATPAAPPVRDVVDDDEGVWAAVLKWVGGLAMRPQMAMALTLVLMVGIGLWYLPELRRSDPADSQAIVDPSPVGEVGPSASLEPAEPLDLEADPRTGRIRPRTPEDAPSAPRPRSRGARRGPAQVAVIPETVEEPAVESAREQGPEATPNEPSSDAVAVVAPPPMPAEFQGVQLQQGQALPVAPSAPSPMPPSMPPSAPVSRGSLLGARAASRDRGAPEPEMADDSAADSDMVPPAQAPAAVPVALHRQARNQRASNDCRSAVASYERLLAGHPRYAETGRAQLEAGDCYRRLGRLADARRMFERASRSPSTAAAARRELTRLDAAEAAPLEAASDSPY